MDVRSPTNHFQFGFSREGPSFKDAIFVSLALLCLATSVSGQIEDLAFVRLGVEQGLPRATVYCMAQDRLGFMWFGTPEGLSRYDGYTFKLYDSTPMYAMSMIYDDGKGSLWFTPSGEIHRLDLATDKISLYLAGCGYTAYLMFQDAADNLWVGARDHGLARYVPSADSFLTYSHIPGDTTSLCNDTVYAIYEDRQGTLWIGTNRGLDKFDRARSSFVHCEQTSMNTIWSIIEDEEQSLWVATNDGLCRLDQTRRQFERYKGEDLSIDDCESLYLTRRNQLWMGVVVGPRARIGQEGGNRIARFNRVMKRFEIIQGSYPDTLIGTGGYYPQNAFFEDRYGRLWVCTGVGLGLLDRTSKVIQIVKPGPNYPSSMAEGYVNGVMEDKTGTVWIMTGNAGVCIVDDNRPSFVHIGQDPYDKIQLSHTYVSAVLQDSSGVLWVGSLHGLDRINLSTGSKRHFDRSPKPDRGPPAGGVYQIIEDGPNVLWLATSAGLCRLDKKDEKFSVFPHHAIELGIRASQRIRALCIDRRGTMWVGGSIASGLLMKFDRPARRYTNYYFPDPEGFQGEHASPISQIYESRDGRLWFTGRVGSYFDRDAGKAMVTGYDYTPSGYASICEDDAGGVWLGSDLGLYRLNSTSGKCQLVADKDKLGDEYIFEILADRGDSSPGAENSGNLWLLTGKGLIKYTPATGDVKHYGSAEGFPIEASEFVNASYKTREGSLYFGGTNGLVMFNPDVVHENALAPDIFITCFNKFNTEAKLDSSPAVKRAVELAYKENVISFDFAALNFIRPQKNQYAYRLEGFDKDWVYCGTRRTTMYTNLDPGTYVFRVKGSNNDGVWNEAGTSLQITILPPYWQTWWFKLLAAAAMAVAFVLFYRHKESQLENEKRSREEFSRQQIESEDMARKKLAAELHDGLAQDLLVASNELQEFLATGNGSKERLEQAAGLVQESIQSVREISSNLHPHHLDRLGFGAAVEAMTESLSRTTGLCVHNSLEKIDGLLGKETEIHLYRIIQEALTNVVRHASARNVYVTVRKNPSSVEIILTDDGKGFTPGGEPASQETIPFAERLHGFGLASMKERARIIGAMIDVTSSPREGTNVHVTLPNIL
jgi:signal transduction histidine kinase/ligand-binding sensor domain-containing protein